MVCIKVESVGNFLTFESISRSLYLVWKFPMVISDVSY